jgi:hypothetical protein
MNDCPYLDAFSVFFDITLTVLLQLILLLLVIIMPKTGPKPKEALKPRWNPYQHGLGPFLGNSNSFLKTAKGQDPEESNSDPDDSVAVDGVRRRPWTRE